MQLEAIKSESVEKKLSYVLITAARNEEAFIEQTIVSVINQTVLPVKWIIVSDGSTDKTDEIVKSYAANHPWIQLIRMPERKERHFAGKAHAFNTGYEIMKKENYDVIGNVDADIAFNKDYMEFLLNKISANPRLGVTGTPFREETQQYNYRFTNIEHVSGACQLFRRDCFESVGGYVPLKMGGIDLNAVLTARMKGWQTRSFTERSCIHNKKTQHGSNARFRAIFKSGYHDYLMGSHPVWQLFRSVYQMSKGPLFIGGILLLTGYLWAMLIRADRTVTDELAEFRGKEQIRRLRDFLMKLLLPTKSAIQND